MNKVYCKGKPRYQQKKDNKKKTVANQIKSKKKKFILHDQSVHRDSTYPA